MQRSEEGSSSDCQQSSPCAQDVDMIPTDVKQVLDDVTDMQAVMPDYTSEISSLAVCRESTHASLLLGDRTPRTTWCPHQRVLPWTKYSNRMIKSGSSADVSHIVKQPTSIPTYVSLSEAGFSFSTADMNSSDVPMTLEPVQSTIAMRDVLELGLVAGGSSSFAGEGFHAEEQKWSDLSESEEATSSRGLPHSNPSTHVADIFTFEQRAAPTSEPELKATGSRGSSRILPSTHASRVPDLPSSASPRSELQELVEPQSSMHVDTARSTYANKNSERSVGNKSSLSRRRPRATVTHEGCSTLRYSRRNNPGLHRPRSYRCHVPGMFINYCTPLHCIPEMDKLHTCSQITNCITL